MDTKEIQEKQKQFDKDYWQINDPSFEKIRHITLHLVKITAKLANYCDKKEHGDQFPTEQIEKDVIPDLLKHSAQLANLMDVDLSEKYIKKLEENISMLSKK